MTLGDATSEKMDSQVSKSLSKGRQKGSQTEPKGDPFITFMEGRGYKLEKESKGIGRVIEV